MPCDRLYCWQMNTPNQFQNLSAESSVDRMAVVTTEEVTEYAGWPSESAEHGLTHDDVEWDMPHDVGEPATPDDDAPAYSDGSGEDDLAEYNQSEASDYING